MQLETRVSEASGTISQHFMMLVQALSGIRSLTGITVNDAEESTFLREALEVLHRNLDFERCSIFLLNNQDELQCVAGLDWSDHKSVSPEQSGHSHTFRPGEGIIGQVLKSGRFYHCMDCRKDDNYLAIIHPQGDHNTGSLICMPIAVGEELLGVLNLSHPEPFFFHPWQEHVISIHASILAQMLYNHRLMKDMATQVSNRTRELQHSLEETEILKSRYQALSVIDDLTQIYNRRYFFSEVPSALARALRYRQPLSLMFMDIDHFKLVNDKYGHDVGDRVLKDIASVLSRQSRKGDIVARMGGEEFALAAPNTDLEAIQLLADRIKDAVSDMKWTFDDGSFGLTLSIGVSQLKLPRENPNSYLNHINEIVQALVREADQALYYCKDTGRNRIKFYSHLDIPS